MTIVDKLKEKLHIGQYDPAAPARTSSEETAASHAKSGQNDPTTTSQSDQNPTGPPKDARSSSTRTDDLPNLPDSEVFDHERVTVIFVLGGPGAGKGTQCEFLVRDYGFVHLSAGDLLRAEQNRPGSQYGDMIKQYIVDGQIVPMEVTVKLLENAMRDAIAKPPTFAESSPLSTAWQGGRGRFLIDGFPRKMDQALKFDEAVCQSSFVLFFSTSEDIMLQRIMERGKTSGRSDDNVESLKKRFKTFVDTSMPVVDYYRENGKVVEVDASPPVEVVYGNVREDVDQRLGLASPTTTTTTQPASTSPAQPQSAVDTTDTNNIPISNVTAGGGIPILGKPAA